MDFVAASNELARCEDVFASDFFLSHASPELETKFMENARLLLLDYVSNVHHVISLKLLAKTLCLGIFVYDKVMCR
jgi:hypothetical protein